MTHDETKVRCITKHEKKKWNVGRGVIDDDYETDTMVKVRKE